MLELVIVIGLAAFRVSRLLALDTILETPRHAFFRRFPPDDHYARMYRLGDTWQITQRVSRKLSWFGRLLACPWCSSVWFTAAIVAGLCYYQSVPAPFLVFGGACSVAGICATLTA